MQTNRTGLFQVFAFVLFIGMMMLPGAGIRSRADEFAVRTNAPTVEEAYFRHYSRPGGLNQCIVRDEANGFVLPNCVGYAWGRAYEVLGYRPRLPMINAWLWYDYNRRAYADTPRKGYPYGSEPRTGSIACWSGTRDGSPWGHVAFIERVHDDGTVTISESYFYGAVFGTSRIPVSELTNLYGYNLQGFIYIWPSSESDFPKPVTLTRLFVSRTPDVTTYEVGDPVNFAGTIIDAVYSDDHVVNVTDQTSFSGHDTATAGEKVVTASFGGLNAEFTISVQPHTHVFDGPFVMKDDDVHERTCTKCHEVIREAHAAVPAQYQYNDTEHFLLCSVCGSRYHVSPHESDGEATYEKAERCTVCGYEIAPVLTSVEETETETEEETEEETLNEASTEAETHESVESEPETVSEPFGLSNPGPVDAPDRNTNESGSKRRTPTPLEQALAGVLILVAFGGVVTFLVFKRRKQ